MCGFRNTYRSFIDYILKLLISVRKPYLIAPRKGCLCLAAPGTGFPTDTTNVDEESRNTLGGALPDLSNPVPTQMFNRK